MRIIGLVGLSLLCISMIMPDLVTAEEIADPCQNQTRRELIEWELPSANEFRGKAIDFLSPEREFRGKVQGADVSREGLRLFVRDATIFITGELLEHILFVPSSGEWFAVTRGGSRSLAHELWLGDRRFRSHYAHPSYCPNEEDRLCECPGISCPINL